MVGAFLRLIRITGFGDLILHYMKIVAVIGASVIAITYRIDIMLLFLIVFSISAKIFAFVVNDLSDTGVDSVNPNARNPLARGEMGRRSAAFIAIMFLAISVFILTLLPPRIVPLGIVGLLLSFTYSWWVRAKFRPLLDVIYHGSLSSIPFVTGYMLYQPFDETCLLASFAIFTLGAIEELMQEIRDHDFDKAWGKTTVTFLGKRKAFTLCLGLMFVLILAILIVSERLFHFPLNILGFSLPFQMIILPPLFLFMTKPVIYGIMRDADQALVYGRLRKRALVVFIIFIYSSIVLFAYNSNSVDVTIGTKNYVFDVEVLTIIAGRESWDVPWILFDYLNQNNFYYLILHKNGVLELGRAINGEYKGYIASLQTGQSPFQPNRFHVSLNRMTISITLDDEYRLTAPRTPPDVPFRIKISSGYLSFTGDLNVRT